MRDDSDESAGGFAGVSGDLRDALDALAPDELTTIEIANEPGWLHRNDAPESNYQAVWAIPTSPTTPYHAPDSTGVVARYLLLDPRTKDSAGNAGHDEWWFVIERYWPSSYPASNHGAFGREVNFHNVAGDAGAQENGNGGVGWDFGSGVSALALDWLPNRPTPTLCVLCAYESEGGENHALPTPARDQWHTYVVHWIAGRTDGSTARPGLVEVWVDGADEPVLRLTNVNTIQRARGDKDGQLYTQRWMQLWEGDYTSAPARRGAAAVHADADRADPRGGAAPIVPRCGRRPSAATVASPATRRRPRSPSSRPRARRPSPGSRLPSKPVYDEAPGRLAQLGEHLPYKQGVTGSSPVPPTREKLLPSRIRGSVVLGRSNSRHRVCLASAHLLFLGSVP